MTAKQSSRVHDDRDNDDDDGDDDDDGHRCHNSTGSTHRERAVDKKKHNRITFCIDPSLVGKQQQLPGIDNGPTRHGALVVAPSGGIDEYVSDEVVYRPSSDADLQRFLGRYNGSVLRNGAPVIVPNNPRGATSGPSSGYYLIHVDLTRSGLGDLSKTMADHHLSGDFRFSSLDGARLLALVGREPNARPNIVSAQAAVPKIPEHPDGMGGNFDAADFVWLNGAAPLNTDVIGAWRYLEYKGFPPDQGPWRTALIAIADDGFALDPVTGQPRDGNLDFGFFFQADMVGHTSSAGVSKPNPNCSAVRDGSTGLCTYHGQAVFSVAAALPGNSFGSAGTGGLVVTPFLIKVDASVYTQSDAIWSAAINGADVVNLSWARQCSDACTSYENWHESYQHSITFATGYGPTAVVVASGNGDSTGTGVAADDWFPCNEAHVICVGAVRVDARAEYYSNFGSNLTIWAPDGEMVTPNPFTVTNPLGRQQVPNFPGTSAAAPYVSGVIALLKTLNHNFTTDDIKRFLQSTATPSPDPVIVSQGVINPLGAVMAASPNEPPTIQITEPLNGAQVVPNSSLQLVSAVSDPEPGFPAHFTVNVEWTSDRDGLLCEGISCTPSHLSFGQHVITATATDAFGATASASITVTAISRPPFVSITYPPTNASFFTDQSVEFRGYALDQVDGFIPAAHLSWSSNLDGKLGTTGDVFAKLSAGTHIVTLSAVNSAGLTGTASVTVIVQTGSDYPTVTIVSPHDFDGYRSGGVVETLVGSATDPVDATLPDSAFVWTDSIDGFLGTGKTINVVLSNTFGVEYYHVITLTVTNAAGHSSTSQITVLVGEIA